MNAISPSADTAKYLRCIEASKAGRWELDRDVIRGRDFDTRTKFLPDGLSLVHELALPDAEARLISQIQGRTYANVFGLVERFITAKLIEVGRDHTLGDQHALEALVRFSDEEIKHQAMFRRIEQMIGGVMPAGYRFDVDADAVARAVLSRSTWSVLVLTLHIELFVQPEILVHEVQARKLHFIPQFRHDAHQSAGAVLAPQQVLFLQSQRHRLHLNFLVEKHILLLLGKERFLG